MSALSRKNGQCFHRCTTASTPIKIPLLALLLFIAATACAKTEQKKKSDEKPPTAAQNFVVVPTNSGPMKITVEIADTDATRTRGLMFRQHLADNEGMLFIFEDSKIQRFWMKNTLIPLDMIFIEGNGRIVGIVENAEPQTLHSRFVDKPSQMVLEVAGGFTSRHALIRDGRTQLQLSPKTRKRWPTLGL